MLLLVARLPFLEHVYEGSQAVSGSLTGSVKPAGSIPAASATAGAKVVYAARKRSGADPTLSVEAAGRK